DASTISEALAGLNPQIDDQIKSYSDYSVYTEQGWTGSLSSLLPGNGYKYYSGNAAPQTLTYSEPAPQNAPPMYGSPAATPDRQWTAATHKYPNNMTVTSVVVLDDVELSGNIEIGAFCGDECRGATLLRNIPTIAGRSTMGFLVIYGNSNEEISLRIYDHVTGAEYQVAAPLLFVSDAIHGVPGNPYRILATATGIDKITTGESIDIIEVIDLNGRSLLKKTGATLQSINNSSLSTGIYLLKITQNGQTSVKKFIKH
ncbi:MAG: T9SS type A sorting domain-containing protein, partial [Dysgonamonadaceae bacterium]|nr:T9SS type A sorting domain-containing protein [Dysgonamonadaceae bacterium]